MTLQQAIDFIKAGMQKKLDSFVGQPVKQEIEILRTQTEDFINALQQKGRLPAMDLSPDHIGPHPEDPNTIQVQWTDPNKVRILREMGMV